MARVLNNLWIPHKPTRKQMEFLLVDDLEIFCGGAAGGGKSEGLLMGALMYIDQPEYARAFFSYFLF